MSALARVRGYLEKIEALNPRLGAFVEVDADGALAAARASDGQALAIKDNIDVAGLHASAGMQALRDRVAERDAACIEKLRRQGAVFLGKTLMDEAALGASGDNPWFGRCHNPARHGFTPGGSSSGSAAAVAAGLCDAALGTDTLGSVRIPASYCGVVGYLPSRGMISAEGVMPLMPEFDRVGVLARTVADAASVAGAMSERGPVTSNSSRASIGILPGLEAFVAPAVAAAAAQAARRLEKAGHRIVEIHGTPLDWGGFDGGGRFVSADSGNILCATHGAEFRLEDGYCLHGPCAGQRLLAVRLGGEGDGLLRFEGLAPTPGAGG